ncbi:MAG TPA: CoA transferase [Vicinamibacterales bacterium]|nr:CoA transferase [Vicinamibacterales bacterium]
MGPLSGITVLDFTRVLSGPYCTMALADLGARVIKLEHPGRGDDTRRWGPPFLGDESAYFLSVNRNKESIAIDFKSPGGREVVARLIAKADVVVENFRPGTLDGLGLDAATVRAERPELIYCSISGYGQTGPRRDEPGYDAVMQAEGGLMSITGAADGPPYRLGVAIVDIVSGMFAAQGVLAALVARGNTGQGQVVDIGMLDAAAALLTYQAGSYFATGAVPGRLGNRHPTIAPYETFATADGDLALAVGNDGLWQAFCRAAGLADLAGDARFATNALRLANYAALKPRLDAAFAARTRADWTARLQAEGVPCGAVRSLDEVFADPQTVAREMVTTVPHATLGQVRVTGVPVKLSETPGGIRTGPPTLGQHTAAILEELGYDQQAVRALADSGAVRL